MPTPLYIPEIGDRITLAEDWTFPLHREHRNAALWDILSGDDDPVIMANLQRREALDAEMSAIMQRGTVVRSDRSLGPVSPYRQPIMRQEDLPRYNALSEERRALLDVEASIAVTLPAGTELAVDRVYIRKGISDYSSLSFNLTATPDPLISAVRGRKRFWAKLADCNRIVMETPEPVAALDRPGL
jgi:hypothetical protein